MAIERYRLLVTDITEFGSLRCVAGWDLDRSVMIRPEPQPGAFWPMVSVGPARAFSVGAVVEFRGQPPNPATPYPHFTEDRVVVGSVTRSASTLGVDRRRQFLAATLSQSMDDLFSCQMQWSNRTRFVAEGVQCRSLGAIEIGASAIQFREDTSKAKSRPRCLISGSGGPMDFSITSLALRELHRSGGIEAIRASLQHASRLHLRIGLARAFPGQPGRCYVQVNGIEIAQ